jgi:hypothetical protein
MMANPSATCGTREADKRAPHVRFFRFKNKLESIFPREKKYIENDENSGKIRGGRKSNLGHFLLLQLLPKFHRF